MKWNFFKKKKKEVSETHLTSEPRPFISVTELEKEIRMEKILEKEMGWKDEDNRHLIDGEEMTIPIIPPDVIENMEVGGEIIIPKEKVEKLKNVYTKFFDENKMSYEDYVSLVLYGVLPKEL